jgi:hypothetical protein
MRIMYRDMRNMLPQPGRPLATEQPASAFPEPGYLSRSAPSLFAAASSPLVVASAATSAADLEEHLTETADAVGRSILELIQYYTIPLLILLVALLALSVATRKLRRYLRRRRPAQLHPRLQKYGGVQQESERLTAQRRTQAEKIRATSTTGTIVGYEIIEQIEAVMVEGFARPEDALEGLKAVAAMKGANAVVNVRQENAVKGRFGATGDAVVVQRPRPAMVDQPAGEEEDEPPCSIAAQFDEVQGIDPKRIRPPQSSGPLPPPPASGAPTPEQLAKPGHLPPPDAQDFSDDPPPPPGRQLPGSSDGGTERRSD